MLRYFDSSFVLALLMHDQNYAEAKEVWDAAAHRFSSLLLKIEVLTVIRRMYAHNQTKLPGDWLVNKEIEFRNLVDEVHIRIIDQSIFTTIELKKNLAQCRSLDAIHVATALDFAGLADPENAYALCTYDRKMHAVAKSSGLQVFPIKLPAAT